MAHFVVFEGLAKFRGKSFIDVNCGQCNDTIELNLNNGKLSSGTCACGKTYVLEGLQANVRVVTPDEEMIDEKRGNNEI